MTYHDSKSRDEYITEALFHAVSTKYGTGLSHVSYKEWFTKFVEIADYLEHTATASWLSLEERIKRKLLNALSFAPEDLEIISEPLTVTFNYKFNSYWDQFPQVINYSLDGKIEFVRDNIEAWKRGIDAALE